MTPAPTLTSREVSLAARSTRALLDVVIDAAGVAFERWILLSQVHQAALDHRPLERAAVLQRFTADLGLTVADAHAEIAAAVTDGLVTDGLVIDGLVADDHTLSLTDTGRALHDRISTQVVAVAARVYGGLPADDLVIARRVLDAVTVRARAELAHLTSRLIPTSPA